MFTKFNCMGWAALALIMFLSSCGMPAQGTLTPTTDQNAVLTSVVLTADARLTEIVQQTPSATPVPPSATPDPSQTAAAQTAQAMLTQVSLLTLTPAASATSTPAPTSASADLAAFVADVTIPDGSDMAPGQAFTKVWRLQNAGSTTWTTSYALVFTRGTAMGTTTSVALTQNVVPGGTVDISVNLVAPSTPGSYTGYWQMRNAAGLYFPVEIYVEIEVISGLVTPTPGTPGAPTVTPTPTATQPGSGNPITSLSMDVDAPVYAGPCPHTFTFSANITLNQTATLTYVLEAGSTTPGFSFNLPPAQTTTFAPGTYTLSFPLEFSSSGTGWVRLHITAPVDMTSNQANFTLTCQ